MDTVQRLKWDWLLPAAFYACFAVLVSVMPNDAYAEQVPATVQYQVQTYGWFSSKTAACDSAVAQSFGGGTLTSASLNASGSCNVTFSFGGGTVLSISEQVQCSAGWTALTGTSPLMCYRPDCAEGQTRHSDGSCGAPPPPECEPGCNGACGSTQIFLNFRSLACIDSCIYRLGEAMGLRSAPNSDIFHYYHTVKENTGASCEPVPDTPEPEPEPSPCPECACAKQGKSWGTVNGVVVCHSPGTPGSQPVMKKDPPTIKTETPAPTPENPNPEPVTTETPAPIITITPNPAGGSPDITETVTNPDGSTTSTSQTQESYCQKNPTASLCKQADEEAKKGSWSGSCGAFQCEGDAVNCAIARKIHQDRCDDLDDMQQFENAASLGKKLLNGEHEADVTAFLNGEGDGNKSINVGGLVSENGAYQFAAQCLSDIQFSIGGHSITVPISKVCPYFEMIGLFLLAAAYLAALRIVEVV